MRNNKLHKTTLAILTLSLGMLCLPSHGLSQQTNAPTNLGIQEMDMGPEYLDNPFVNKSQGTRNLRLSAHKTILQQHKLIPGGYISIRPLRENWTILSIPTE